jgi:hypothetical protein
MVSFLGRLMLWLKYIKKDSIYGFNGDESDELPLAATYVIDQMEELSIRFRC